MKTIIFLRHLFTAFGLIACLAVPLSAHAGGKPGVVIQMSENDPAKWNLALNNARNLITAMGGADKVDVEIVAYGPGLGMLKEDSAVGERLGGVLSEGVKLSACGNTMRAQKVSETDLHMGVQVVSAGVMEIMQRQQSGWAYIRP
jgi:intracellular sulfur oxidation DsrE/DsrF family protein